MVQSSDYSAQFQRLQGQLDQLIQMSMNQAPQQQLQVPAPQGVSGDIKKLEDLIKTALDIKAADEKAREHNAQLALETRELKDNNEQRTRICRRGATQ